MAKLGESAAEKKDTTPGRRAAPGAVKGAAWSPPVASTSSADWPRLSPSPAFVLQAHPRRWGVMRDRVIPVLGRLMLQPGVNNVSVVEKTGEVKWKAAAAAREERGWTSIPWDVDGPNTSYLYEPRPGTVLERWTKCYPGSERVTCDEVAYVEWCRSLVDRGVIAAPAAYVLESMLDSERSSLATALEQAHNSPAAKQDAERIVKRIACIEAELAEVSAEAA